MATQLILHGRVQGVFCRNYCRQYAMKMKIRGSATNLRDGTVRVILETDDESAVKRYILNLKKNPYGMAFYGSIEDVDVSGYDGPLRGDYVF